MQSDKQGKEKEMERWSGSKKCLLASLPCRMSRPAAHSKEFPWHFRGRVSGESPKRLLHSDAQTEGTSLATCRPCAMFVFLPKALSNYVCYKCKLISLLEVRGKDLRNALCATVSSGGWRVPRGNESDNPRRNPGNQKMLSNGIDSNLKKMWTIHQPYLMSFL